MVFRNNKPLILDNPLNLHLMLNPGGMGDLIHCIPAVDALLKKYPWQKYKIYVPEYMVPLFKKLYKKTPVNAFNQAPKKADGKINGIIAFNINRHSSLHIHLTDYAFYMLLDRLPYDDEERSLRSFRPNINVRRFKLPKEYAVISPFFRLNLKEMPAQTLDAICLDFKRRGITPVLLGSSGQMYDSSQNLKTDGFRTWTPEDPEGIIDLTNKTNILETLEILWGAKLLVTMDGGLVHLCSLSPTPIVAGFTFCSPESRLPYKKGKLSENVYTVIPQVECRFCQTNWCSVFSTQHEFSRCYYGDRMCVQEMTSNKFLSKINAALISSNPKENL